MIIRIVAGGPEAELPELKKSSDVTEQWIGVDRGALYLLDQDIIPSRAFGDFDSITEQEWERLAAKISNHVQFPAEKDETDLEIALNHAISQKPEMIFLYGVTGGRLDHFFGAVTLLLKKDLPCPVVIIDRQNELSIYSPGEAVIKRKEGWPYVSFFSLNERVEGLTLSGFKYPLDNYTIQLGSSRCVSNEIVEKKGVFSFRSGILMVIRSRDGRRS
ncbi:thiamine diphosphokinase [Domibacillus robiginosus]|uniref:thiamine diphosphokinase n=1 Tax=Domibacillus robiginosus TaxID=1071054 RepID=UPI00067D9BA9|nr:thiamine diphosphokinase [Domibacillus robiginosus]